VVALTESLALELAPEVLVNSIAPRPILAPPGMTPDEHAEVMNATPLRRWGGAEEIAKAVLFLVNSDFVTGECLRVDGGRHVDARFSQLRALVKAGRLLKLDRGASVWICPILWADSRPLSAAMPVETAADATQVSRTVKPVSNLPQIGREGHHRHLKAKRLAECARNLAVACAPRGPSASAAV
jgi:hypothetical protein